MMEDEAGEEERRVGRKVRRSAKLKVEGKARRREKKRHGKTSRKTCNWSRMEEKKKVWGVRNVER